MRAFTKVALACLSATLFAGPMTATAQTVVELFTSQSCSSCPPAEAYFRDLAKRPDLVALEWHVDYWDDLRAGSAGRWKDPFSSPANTARQRQYNVRLRGRGDVYTPQAVVGGVSEAVGSDRDEIEQLVKRAPVSTVRISKPASAGAAFTVSGAPPNAEGLLVVFQTSAATRVAGGENKGRQLASANIVTSARTVKLGGSIAGPKLEAGEGCALLVTDPKTGRVLSGAYCAM